MSKETHTNAHAKASQRPKGQERKHQFKPSRIFAGECSACRWGKVVSHEVPRSSERSLDPGAGVFMNGRFEHDFSRIPAYSKSPIIVQAKLAVNILGDIYEQEADRIADQVLAAPAHSAIGVAPPRIQRFPGQAKGQIDVATEGVDRILAGSGRPLEPGMQQDMGQRLGYDFSQVRVHTGPDAGQSAREMNANAYTSGHNIVFGAGRFEPGTQEGRRLIAHELAHVVQQSEAEGANIGRRNGNRGRLPVHRLSNGTQAVIQRDEAGGGSTEFEDKVTMMSRPTSGPGIIQGTVTRTETAPMKGSQPKQVIHRGEMHVRFDPSDCSITIPFGYNFVQAAQASSTGFCDDPPPSTKVPLLPADRFNSLKASVISDVNRGLNGWFDVRLSGKACPTGCANKTLPIRVDVHEDTAHPDTTIDVVNRGGRANAGTICAASWNRSTSVHEGGHQALGVGDEYPELDERLRATAPEWFRRERVRRDYSVMGPESSSRFAMFHERHFNAVKTFLEDAFPGCKAALQAHPRPIIRDYRLTMGYGRAWLSGVSGNFFEAGLSVGIPLDRLRRWELVLGPQFNMMWTLNDKGSQNAFLLGARLGLERSTGGGGHGFTAGAFGEVGHGWFSSTEYGAGGAGRRSARSAYGELGLGMGYRAPLRGDFRFDIRVEGAAGAAMGQGIIGPTTREIETDPSRSRWFRLGLAIGGQF